MSCESQSRAALRGSGQRLTTARLLVMSALRHAGGHMTASQIIEDISGTFAHLQPSTVYRTLTALKEARLVSETRIGRGEAAYEWLGDESPHHHLICRACGAETVLEHDFLQDLATKVEQAYGFSPDLDHMALEGTCAGCRVSSAAAVRAT